MDTVVWNQIVKLSLLRNVSLMKTDKKVTDLDTIVLSSGWNYNKYISKNDKINVNKKYIG